jgi:hypothetical protein
LGGNSPEKKVPMRMVITTEIEEGAHHVSEDLYKAIMLVLLDNNSFPVAPEKAEE